MKEARKSKGLFMFYNHNPKGSLSACDCVIRAIGKALNQSWETTYKELSEIGLELFDVTGSDKVYELYLKRKGFEKCKRPVKKTNKRYTFGEFANLHKKGTFILRTSGHLTVLIDGYLYDTWDSSTCTLGNYFSL